MRRLILGLLILGVVSCSNTSTAPTGTASIAGTWTGPLTFSVPPAQGVTFTLTVILIQSGSAVTGTWNAAADATNVISGTVTGNVNGVTFDGTLTDSAPCSTVVATFSTIAGTTSMTWTSASGFTGGGVDCLGATSSGFSVSLTKVTSLVAQ
jgi:hypothetical protein